MNDVKIKTGYHKLWLAEPLILELEDWMPIQRDVLCKMCGLAPSQTERIVLHVETMEFFENLEKRAEGADRTYTVTEMCPHCESEVEMRWDTNTMGFKAFCPFCGKRLMLCDECQHSDSGPCDYDDETDTCRFNKAEMKVLQSLEVETPLGTIMAKGAGDKEHPGLCIELHRQNVNRHNMLLALIEFCQDEAGLPEGEPNIITRVWEDGDRNDYSYRIVHVGIDEHFRMEDETYE